MTAATTIEDAVRRADGPRGVRGPRFRSLSFYPDLLHVERIHGHSGRTRVVWLDDVEAARKLVSWFEPAGEAATAI